MLACGLGNGDIGIWDRTPWQRLNLFKGDFVYVSCLSWLPGSKVLASCSPDPVIYLWDLDTRKLLSTISGHFLGISSLVWLSTRQILASGSSDQTIRLWDTQSGR